MFTNVEESLMNIVERLIAGAVTSEALTGTFDVEARDRWPDLWQLLSLTELAGGHKRVPSSLKVTLGRAEWMVSINDEDTRQTLLVASPSLTALFDRVECQLHSADAVWRQWPPKPGAHRRK